MFEEYTSKIFSSEDGSLSQIAMSFAEQYLNLIYENRMFIYSMLIGVVLGYLIFKVRNKSK